MTKRSPRFLLRFATARCGWFWTIAASMPRSRRRCFDRSEIGCSRETLRLWVRRPTRPGNAAGPTTRRAGAVQALEREVRELRQANDILRKASAYFAQAELDRRFKP